MSRAVASRRHEAVGTVGTEGLWDPAGLELPKDPAWVAVARLAAAGIAYRAGASYDAIEDVRVIVAEAVSFCIQHGKPGGRLRISFEAPAGALVVIVRDPDFPVMTSPKRHNGSNQLDFIDGLFLIRGLADDVEYSATATDGLTLRVTRKIA